MATNSEIYDFVLRQCSQCRLPRPWHRLGGTVLRTTFSDAAQFSAALDAQFSADDLRAAGVLVESENHQVLLRPALARRGAIVVGLYERAGGSATDLIVGGRSLSGRLPLLSVLRDHRTRRFLRQDPFLPMCVAGSMPDLAALWGAGLPTAPASGLASVRGERLDRLCEALRFESRTRRHGEHSPIALTLVDWSISRMQATPLAMMESIRQQLRGLSTYLGIDVKSTTSWTASAADLGRLEFVLRAGSREDLERALLHCIRESSTDVIPAATPAEPSYAAALAAWLRAPDSYANGDDASKLWRDLRAAYDADVGAKLLRAADECKDPARAELLRKLADLCRVGALPSARIHLKQSMLENPVLIDPAELDQMLKITRQIVLIIRELS